MVLVVDAARSLVHLPRLPLAFPWKSERIQKKKTEERRRRRKRRGRKEEEARITIMTKEKMMIRRTMS